eukprot:scaffold4880_cov106-Cylindrotheca_fusiformis.AAC.15
MISLFSAHRQQSTTGRLRAEETMSERRNDFGNRPTDLNDFSEIDAPRDLDANESDFNETEVKELATKVSKITLDEREAGLFDIHGVAPSLKEDPEILTKSLKEMNELLTKMAFWKQARAFKLAESNAPEYARNHKLLLMFLRCENFDVKAAATRLIAFFRHKLSLFGPEKLCKETIGQSDLDAEDLKCVTAGYVQLLPRRDHVGRAQFIYFSRFGHWDTPDNVLKMMYYFCMAALRDEETQRKGFVLIIHSVGNEGSNPKEKDPIVAWKSIQLMRKVLPIKLVSHHVCSSPTSGLRFFFSYIAKFFDSAGIARTRFHEGMFVEIRAAAFVACTCTGHFELISVCFLITGTFEEIDQKLAGFGINGLNLVISYEGDLKLERHKEMIRCLKSLEAQTSPTEDYVILPMHTDVLFGRGKPTQNHPGNLRLSLIAESLLEKYDGFDKRQEKQQLTAETVERMKMAGVRFLSKCDEGWKIAPDKLARERVSYTFRTVRGRLKTQESALVRSRFVESGFRSKRNRRALEDG